MKIGGEIKELIQKKGMTQSFVAAAVGISPQTFNGICNNRQGIPLETYFKLCEVLGVPLEYFREHANENVSA